MANTWNQALTTWGQNQWGEQTQIDVSITGVSATSSVGSPTVFNEQGWGRDTWGSENWGQSAFTIIPTGVSAPASVGAISPSEMVIGPIEPHRTRGPGVSTPHSAEVHKRVRERTSRLRYELNYL